MNQQIASLIRHLMTAVGPLLAASGISESMWNELVGGVIAITGVVWAYIKNRKAAKAAQQ